MTRLLHEFLEPHWRQRPDRIALDIPPGRDRPGRVQLTYAQLAARASTIASHLPAATTKDAIAAILLPRTSGDAYAAQIAILSAGVAYTAIDPSLPDGRVSAILDDAQPIALVTDQAGAERVRNICFDGVQILTGTEVDLWKTRTQFESSFPQIDLRPRVTDSSLAYVIYTSGTTGHPKGVMVAHQAIANLIASDVAQFRLTPDDRVAQGSSHAYDSSIEEIWLAFSAGAMLVVVDDETIRAGPDLAAWLEREHISVFCPPPTLLRTLGGSEAAERLRDLRLLYVGGEALPRDVADIWAPRRRLVNGYGPTECAVTALRTDVQSNEAISIGHPIDGVSAWILDNQLGDVEDGEPGELCLGGTGLARGYVHAPDLTDRKFPQHPIHGRLYRTGDLAHRDGSGRFFYHGRMDSQVKVRGHRIELGDIEAHLMRCAAIRAAACCMLTTDGRQELAAFVVASSENRPSVRDLQTTLAAVLPGPMVPQHIQFVETLPRTTGGKIDRAALAVGHGDGARLWKTLSESSEFSTVELRPRTPVESLIDQTLRTLLSRDEPVPIESDFFTDLGVDSLRAAELVTALRSRTETEGLTVRDVYEAPTVSLLATRAMATPVTGSTSRRHATPKRAAVITCAQVVWMLGELVTGSVMAYAFVAHILPRVVSSLGLAWFVLLMPTLAAGSAVMYAAATLGFAVLAKRVLIGRYAPTCTPVWSAFYLRHWIVQQTARLVPWSLLCGTELQSMVLRALGARIGRRVHLHRGVDLSQGGWDLLDIGDDVTVGQDASLRLVELEAGYLIVGSIALGDGVTVETRAGVGVFVTVGGGSYVTAQSDLAAGIDVPANERWEGVPARCVGAPSARSRQAGDEGTRQPLSPMRYSMLLLLTELAVASILGLPAGLLVLSVAVANGADASNISGWLAAPTWDETPLVILAVVTVAAVPVTLMWQAALARMLGRVPIGVIDRWSWTYMRLWMTTSLVNSAGDWLSGTLFWPLWLRASGMRIGSGCEISTIIDVVPSCVEIGAGSFLADGVYLGGPVVDRGKVTLARTRLGSGVFVGNHAIVPAGHTIADGVLLGVSTVADVGATRPDTSWFGQPAFSLARPRTTNWDRRLTHQPSAIRYINRLLWEMSRCVIPVVPLIALIAWTSSATAAARLTSPFLLIVIALPALTIAAGAAVCAIVLLLKWMLLGRVRPGEHPLWSCWCSRWDYLYVVWAQLARPFLTNLEGTLLLAWYLRAMGARIGRRVVLGRGFAQVVDPDMLCVDDEVTLQALLQAHTFEDRVLKIDRVRVRRQATVESGVVLLYGSDVGERTHVVAHSVVMKRERLLSGRVYAGCPTRQIS